MKLIVSVDSSTLKTALRGYPARLLAALQRVVTRFSVEIQRAVKESKLSGQVLHTRTGTLRRSINREVTTNRSGVFAVVGTNVSYGAIHEYGGTVPAHLVEAKRARALAFSPKGGGGVIFRKRVWIPDVKMPERSFLRSTLREHQAAFQVEVQRAAREAVFK